MATSKKRCAIYTRKSTEEGLDQEFNSLDAQREACEAFVQSQKHEGWQLEKRRFDDGGFSGGNLDRPAMTALLDEIKAGRIDVVVVYKVDRLTRSLADFAKIVDVFDGQGVSFVSVTQQFNTTTSMGRLTLNMLLSFAQFEREVTSERIRDKVAASKKKGMWMGGNVPLGYDNKNRTLIINDNEAYRVRRLFQIYLNAGNVRTALQQARVENLTNKSESPFTRTNYYKLLRNHLYVGEISHKGNVFPAQHKAIVDRNTWELVQARLTANAVEREQRTKAKHPSLLAGKLFDADGEPFSPSHAVKNGKRYRYYIARSTTNGGAPARNVRRKRIAAHEIESTVVIGLTRFLADPQKLVDELCKNGAGADEIKMALGALNLLKQQLEIETADFFDVKRMLIERVAILEAAIEIELNGTALMEHLGFPTDRTEGRNPIETIPTEFRYRGVELKLVVPTPDGGIPTNPDPVLIKAVVRAHNWWQRLISNEALTIGQLAAEENVSSKWVRRVLELAFLPGPITRAILEGTQPPDLSLRPLLDLAANSR